RMSSPSHMVVRPAGAVDAGAVADLWTGLGYPCTKDEAGARLVRLYAATDVVLLAFDGDRAVGLAATHLMYMPHAGELWCRITSLVVAEGHRRRGVGAALMRRVERLAADAGGGGLAARCSDRGEGGAAFIVAMR